MQEWINKLYKADISFSAGGDSTVIAAPGLGKRLAIDFLYLQTTGASNITLKDDTPAYGGVLPVAANGVVRLENNILNQDGVITLSPNLAFVVNSSASTQVSGFVRYRIMEGN